MTDKHFIGLVHSILSSAEAALGELDSPMVTKLARDGALARRTGERSLELLDMLARKTFGNLDDTERDSLHRAQRRVRELLAAPVPGAEGDGPGSN